MAVTVADLEVLLSLDDSNFRKNVTQATRKIESFKNITKGLGESLTRNVTMPLAIAGVGVVAFGAKAFRSAAQVDTMERGLTALMGSAQDARKEMEKLKKIAELPGIDFKTALAGSQRLQAVGLSADRARKLMEGLANANARAGGSAENLDGVLIQLGQTLSSGRLQGDELRILSERIPEFRKVLKEQFGTSNSEVIGNAMKSGKLSMEAFIDGMTQGLAKLPRAKAGIQTTLKNLQNEIFLGMAEIGKELIPVVESMIPEIQKAFRDLTPEIKELAASMSKDLVPTIKLTIEVIAGLVKGFAALPDWMKKSLVGATLFAGVLGPLLRFVSGLTGLVQGLVATRTAMVAWWAANTAGAVGFTAALTGLKAAAATLAPLLLSLSGILASVAAIALPAWLIGLINIEVAKQKVSEAEIRGMDVRLNTWKTITGQIKTDLKTGTEAAAKNFREMMNTPGLKGTEFLVDWRRLLNAELIKTKRVLDEEGKIITLAEQARRQSAGGGDMPKFDLTDTGEDKTKGIKDRIADLRREIALFGNDSAEAAAKYDVLKGDLKGMPKVLKDQLVDWAQKSDLLKENTEHAELFHGAMRDLQMQMIGLNEITNEGNARIETAIGKYKGLTDAEKEEIITKAKALDVGEKRNKIFKEAGQAAEKERERIKALNEQIREHQKAVQADSVAQLNALRETVMLNAAATESERNRIEVSMEFFKNVAKGFAPEMAAMIATIQRKIFLDKESADATERVAGAIAKYKDQIRQAALEVSGLSQEEIARLAILNDADLRNATKTQIDDLMDFFKANQQFIKLREMASEVAQGMTDTFMDALTKIREDGFGSFFRNVLAGLDQMLFEMGAKILQSQVMNLLQNLIISTASGGSGGGVDTGFGGSGTPPVPKARGGPVVHGGAYLVGERGPEMFYPNRSGTIVPNAALAGGGAVTVNINVHGATDANSFRKSSGQIAGEVARQIDAARKRGF